MAHPAVTGEAPGVEDQVDALAAGVTGEPEHHRDGRAPVEREDMEAGFRRAFRGDYEILRLPANEPHAVKAVSPFKMLLIMIRE